VPETTAARTYFPALDGVRAIAILMVMVFHLAQSGIPIPGPTIIGQTGVDLFFVLSGFLITGILLKSPQGDWHEIHTFYIRRTLRIFPLYYATILLLDLAGRHVSFAFWIYLQDFYYAANWPIGDPIHFWSLAIEEQFYLLWPFVVLFLPRRRLMPALWLMIATALLIRIPLIHAGISPFFFPLSRFDALSAGAILALLQQSGTLTRYRRPLIALFVVSALLVGLQGKAAAHSPNLFWVQVTKFTALAAFYAAGIGIVLTSRANLLTRSLSAAPLRFIGRIAYGLYVFHPIVYGIVFAWFAAKSPLIRAAIAVASTFVCALISWYGMERYMIALKDKLAPERAQFPTTAPPMTTL
jgi:peptidoglycan/LPS O-acetylase OafA/YrhL